MKLEDHQAEWMERQAIPERILDSLGIGLAVLDQDGVIRKVNQTWLDLARAQGLETDFAGQNYFRVCESPSGPHFGGSREAARGVRSVIRGEEASFRMEYPCRSSDKDYWYQMEVIPLHEEAPSWVMVLHTDVTARKQMVDRLEAASSELQERVKELSCLYAISRLAEKDNLTLEELLEQIARVIPASWRYPEIAVAKIRLDEHEFLSEGFLETPWRLAAPLKIYGSVSGMVEVCYREARPPLDMGPFFKGERALLEAVSERLGRIIERMRAHQALTRSEIKYRTLLEHLPHGIFLKDAASAYVSCNRVFAGYLGMEPEEVHGKTDSALLPAEMAHQIMGEDRRLLDEGGRIECTRRFMHPEGELWVRSIKVRVMGEHDEPIGILGISEDISERKRTEEALRKAHEELELRVAERTRELTSANRALAAQIAAREKVEEALRESEEKYRTLVESSPEAIFVQTGGCFAFLNSAAVRLFGLKSADRLLGRPVIEVFHPEDRSRIAERIRILNEQKIPVPNLEERCLRPDGTHVEVEVSAVPLQYDRQDGALVFAREIRERKRAERALKESETRFRSVFDNTSVPIALVDLTGHILLVNEAFEQFLAYGRGELKGVHYSRITHPEDLEADEEKLEALLKSGAGHYQMDKRYLSRSGRVVWGRLTVSLVSDPQKGPQYLVGICEDITERKALEIHASRVRHLTSIGELAAGVAHEINNPINGIINYAQIMLDTEDDPDMRAQLLPKVIQEGERIAGIVKKLLSFARATHNDKQPVRVEPILADSIALMAARFRKDGIRITLDIADSLPPILANRQEIEQVFLNLLSNARYSLNEKFPEMDDRKRIEIRAARVDPSQGDRVRVSILDSGTGIPRPVLDRIFDPFYSTKPPDEGAGLGLSISYGIVAEHAGRIYFESEPGHCTQAIVELPAAVETTAGD